LTYETTESNDSSCADGSVGWPDACPDSPGSPVRRYGVSEWRVVMPDETNIGHVTEAMFFIAWSHPGRGRSESAFARLEVCSLGCERKAIDQQNVGEYLVND
jgi:hypothetical protein